MKHLSHVPLLLTITVGVVNYELLRELSFVFHFRVQVRVFISDYCNIHHTQNMHTFQRRHVNYFIIIFVFFFSFACLSSNRHVEQNWLGTTFNTELCVRP